MNCASLRRLLLLIALGLGRCALAPEARAQGVPFLPDPAADSLATARRDSIAASVSDSLAAPAADSLATAERPSGRGVDYVWVLRGALVEPASIDSVIERARRMRVRGLLVQVVGRGDAYYRSDVLPQAEALGARSDADPLASIVDRAHACGLEVHAWVNCMLVWSSRRPPRDSRHVLRAHPEWVAAIPGGRRMSRLSPRAIRRLRVEGVYLAPAHPGVRAWLAQITAEIASRYAVDGIHLDYIRQPDTEVGYDPTTRARFALEHGVDPARISDLPRDRQRAVRAAWREFQREQVTSVVRAIRDTLRAVRPGVTLSAAVIPDTSRTLGLAAQPWRPWLRDTLIDQAFVMCYAPAVQTVLDQLVEIDRSVGSRERVVPGIAVYNTSPATAAVKLKGARALGYSRLALYSYDSLFTRQGAWTSLEQGLEDPRFADGP